MNKCPEQNGSNSFLLFKDTLSINYCQNYRMHARKSKTRTHVKLECSNKMVDPKGALIKGWFLVKVYKMHRKFGDHYVEYRDPIYLMDCQSNMEIGLCWYV